MTQPKPRKNAPGAGRPAALVRPKRINIYLDEHQIETARQLGQNNISEGVRLALKQAAKK